MECQYAFQATHRNNDFDSLAHQFYTVFPDGMIAMQDGVLVLVVVTDNDEASLPSFEQGLQIVYAIEKGLPGVRIRRVDQDLVDASEISSRFDVSRQTVHNWANGERRQGFPPPIGSPGGKRIWSWGQITTWARSNTEGFDHPLALEPEQAALLDAYLIGHDVIRGQSSAGDAAPPIDLAWPSFMQAIVRASRTEHHKSVRSTARPGSAGDQRDALDQALAELLGGPAKKQDPNDRSAAPPGDVWLT